MREGSIRACGVMLGTATALAILLSGRQQNTCITATLEGETTRVCTLVGITPIPPAAWVLVGLVGAVAGCAIAELVRRHARALLSRVGG